MHAARPWRLSVFGAPKLTAPDGVERHLEGKALALLTYLALEGPTSRSRLAGLLWPDSSEDRARNNLVQQLRRMARQHGLALITGHTALDLVSELWVDARAWPTPSEPPQGVLLRGADFDDLPDLADWLLSQRERTDALRTSQWLDRALAAEQAERWPEAIHAVQQVLDLDPLSEEASRRLMRLLYRQGDRAAALRVYQRCQELLERHLEVEPLPETVQLAQDIQRGTLNIADRSSAPALPPGTLRPSSLVGREAAWEALERAWTQGQFILVTGEAGAGKSRLLEDFVASKGAALWVEGRPGDAVLPYATTARDLRRILVEAEGLTLEPWMRAALGHLLPELATDTTVPVSEMQLHRAIHSVFQQAAGNAVALAYEDLHFADDASIEAGFVLIGSAFPLGQPGGVPHMIATLRRGEASVYTTSLYQRLIDAGQAVEIQLGPLDETAVAELLAQLQGPEAPQRWGQLARYAGGNPLFVLETVRDLLEAGESTLPSQLPVPQRVGALIEQRLRRLSSGALNTARAAAVLQSALDLELIATVLNAPLLEVVASWEELEAAQIVTGERFVHDVLQHVVLERIPLAIRRVLHRNAAKALTQAGAGAALVAEQWRQGGVAHLAAPLFEHAGYDAIALSRPREARELLHLASEMYTASGDASAARNVGLVLESVE